MLREVPVSLRLCLCLLVMPVAVEAQGAATLVELVPNLSLRGARADGVTAPDSDGSPPRDGGATQFLLQQYFSFSGDPQRSRVNQLTLQPFVTKLLPGSWYVQTQRVITLDFARGTSSVPLNLVVGKLFAGKWDVSLQGTAGSTMDVAALQEL